MLGGVLSKLAVGTGRWGVGAEVREDPFDRIEAYANQRLADDHGVWATVVFDEVVLLGCDGSYPAFTRELRQRQFRPHREAWSGVKGRATVVFDDPSGGAGVAKSVVG